MRQQWQDELINQIRCPEQLLERLKLDRKLLPAAKQAAALFPLKVTESYLGRIEPSAIDDPLLRQVLPLGYELNESEGFVEDPLGERAANPLPGLLHKYQSRVLLTLSSNCAIHCRYCFRRHFAYDENNPGRSGWDNIFEYIKAHPKVNEIILSGGDPLSVNDVTLLKFSDALKSLPQIKRLRIHTRIPVVLPSRVTRDFVSWLQNLHIPIVLVLHVNHANEIDHHVTEAIALLKSASVTVLNQAVLLRGVNDSVEALSNLSEKLFESGVLPYYLFLLDKVKGVQHFEVPHDQALTIYKALQAKLPGFLVPKLAYEKAGERSKTLVF